MKPHIIHTEGSGLLAKDCTPADVKAIALAMAQSDHAVIHLHGGLNNEKTARELAARLDPYYGEKGKLTAVFFAWETGPFETVRNNLGRIGSEPIFKALMKKLLRHVAGKAFLDKPGKSVGECPLPVPVEVEVEWDKRKEIHEDNVPYGNKKPIEGVSAVTKDEEKRFKTELAADVDFERAVAGILKGLKPKLPAGAKSVVADIPADTTLMSKDVKEELVATAEKPNSKGFLETAALVKRAVAVFIRVVKRIKDKRDHGVYTTIVEELTRELYIDSIGSLVWGSMKNDARDNFKPVAGSKRPGGTTLFQELSAIFKERESKGESLPKLSVVGHSAGAIFACHLLLHLAATYPDIKLHRLVFLAAACRHDLFAEVLAKHEAGKLWEDFRAYALLDSLESGYWEVPAVYPRSLLYIVSGIAEADGGKPAFDMPLVGMERYFKNTGVYKDKDVTKVRAFLDQPSRQVWSHAANMANGLNSDAIRHGAFDDTTGARVSTMKSVIEFVTG